MFYHRILQKGLGALEKGSSYPHTLLRERPLKGGGIGSCFPCFLYKLSLSGMNIHGPGGNFSLRDGGCVYNCKGEICVCSDRACAGRRGSRVCSSPGEMCNIGPVPLLRLERLWQEELNEVGPAAASLRRVVWMFCRTRLILSIMCLMITQLAGFSGPVSSNCPF